MARNQDWFNLPNMLGGPSNFFGPEGPADPAGLARDMRYQRHLTAIARLHPVRPTPHDHPLHRLHTKEAALGRYLRLHKRASLIADC